MGATNECCFFNLAKLNAAGTVLWTAYIEGTAPSGANVVEVEALPGTYDVLCVVESGGVYSLVRVDNTGAEVWSVSLGSGMGMLYRGVGANSSRIYYAEDYAVTCLNFSGVVQWTYSSSGNQILGIQVGNLSVLLYRVSSPYSVVLNASTGAVSTSSTTATNQPAAIYTPFPSAIGASFIRYGATYLEQCQLTGGTITVMQIFSLVGGWQIGRSRWRDNSNAIVFTAPNRAGIIRNGGPPGGTTWTTTSLSGSTASSFQPNDIECDNVNVYIATNLQDYDPGTGRYNTNLICRAATGSGSFNWAARLEFGKNSGSAQDCNSIVKSDEGYLYAGGNGGEG